MSLFDSSDDESDYYLNYSDYDSDGDRYIVVSRTNPIATTTTENRVKHDYKDLDTLYQNLKEYAFGSFPWRNEPQLFNETVFRDFLAYSTNYFSTMIEEIPSCYPNKFSYRELLNGYERSKDPVILLTSLFKEEMTKIDQKQYYKGIHYRNGALAHILKYYKDGTLLYEIFDYIFRTKLFQDRSLITYKSELLPISSIIDSISTIKEAKKSVEKVYNTIMAIIENVYPDAQVKTKATKKNTTWTNSTIQDDKKKKEKPYKAIDFSLDFIESILKLIADDSKASVNISTFVTFICQRVLPTISSELLETLREKLMKVIPIIFKYSTGIPDGEHRSIGYKNLSVFKDRFGKQFIEEHSFQYFLSWVERQSKPLDYIFAAYSASVLDAIGVDSPVISKNIEVIYDTMCAFYTFPKLKLTTLLTMNTFFAPIIKRYQKLSDTNAAMIYKGLSIYIPNNFTLHVLYMLEVLAITNPLFIKDHLGEIFLRLNPNLKRPGASHLLGTILVALDDHFRSHPKFQEFYQAIQKSYANEPTGNFYLEALVKFNREPASLLKFTSCSGRRYFWEEAYQNSKQHFYLYEKLKELPDKDITKEEKTKIFEIFKFGFTELLKVPEHLNPDKLILQYAKTKKEILQTLSYAALENLFIQLAPQYAQSELGKECVNILLDNLLKPSNPQSEPNYSQARTYLSQLTRYMNVDTKVKTLLENDKLLFVSKEFESQLPTVARLFVSLNDFPQYFLSFLEKQDYYSDRTFVFLTKLVKYIMIKNPNMIRSFDNVNPSSYFSILFEKSLSNDYRSIVNSVQCFKYCTDYKLPKKIIDNLLKQFKVSGTIVKKMVVKKIKKHNIAALSFMLDEYYLKFRVEEESERTGSYVPNTILQNILRFIYIDKSVEFRELFHMALISKSFLLESKKLLSKMRTVRMTIRDTISTDPLSMFPEDIYHMNYSDLQFIPWKKAVERFFTLPSLHIDQPFYYRVTSNLDVLTHLEITQRVHENQHPNIPFLGYQQMFKFTSNLITLKFRILTIWDEKVESCFTTLLEKNKNLKLVKIYLKQFNYDKTNMLPLFELLKKHQVTMESEKKPFIFKLILDGCVPQTPILAKYCEFIYRINSTSSYDFESLSNQDTTDFIRLEKLKCNPISSDRFNFLMAPHLKYLTFFVKSDDPFSAVKEFIKYFSSTITTLKVLNEKAYKGTSTFDKPGKLKSFFNDLPQNIQKVIVCRTNGASTVSPNLDLTSIKNGFVLINEQNRTIFRRINN
ncbi:hypothetical protein DLAC_05414 [Tieghemostelium lacteum]|uniref:Uncharacterized protein n=1 Tax=Tieghemostelium lacteum TaxID=361077 RepID=A0A151ZFZ2_TIELA|nr:hypothetical protein DLAC_05414 [Tieghemostelium lacteum]|eukprot:KYQ92829.1 hypothetical protein DLAC_05414 [Tieghemostelium lacteum]